MPPEPRIGLTTLLLCDYALTSQDGKISAIGIFSQITVNRLPTAHPRLFIVAVLEADPGPYELELQVLAPSGTGLLREQPRLRITVPDGATTANIVADLKGLRITEIGRHRIELHAGSRLLGSAPFTISLVWRQQKVASA
ncbi:MAG: hypothetical protein M3295_04485 [Chloroflexota bacterium]|nr:hypothetical protein [Chloroflexota bacterium]